MVLALNMMDGARGPTAAPWTSTRSRRRSASLWCPIPRRPRTRASASSPSTRSTWRATANTPAGSTSARRTAPDGGALHRCIHGICHPDRRPRRGRAHSRALCRDQAHRGRPAGHRGAGARPKRARRGGAHHLPDGGRGRHRPHGRARRHALLVYRGGLQRPAWSSRARGREHKRSVAADRILTGKYNGDPGVHRHHGARLLADL